MKKAGELELKKNSELSKKKLKERQLQNIHKHAVSLEKYIFYKKFS